MDIDLPLPASDLPVASHNNSLPHPPAAAAAAAVRAPLVLPRGWPDSKQPAEGAEGGCGPPPAYSTLSLRDCEEEPPVYEEAMRLYCGGGRREAARPADNTNDDEDIV